MCQDEGSPLRLRANNGLNAVHRKLLISRPISSAIHDLPRVRVRAGRGRGCYNRAVLVLRTHGHRAQSGGKSIGHSRTGEAGVGARHYRQIAAAGLSLAVSAVVYDYAPIGAIGPSAKRPQLSVRSVSGPKSGDPRLGTSAVEVTSDMPVTSLIGRP